MRTMVVFERGTIRQRRFLVFIRAQLPLLVGTTFVIGSALVVVPEVRDDVFLLVGGLVIVASCVIGLLVPWHKITAPGLVVLAIADVIGVAFVRESLFRYVPSVEILAIFPVLWLAYGFSQWVVVAAVAGTIFIAAFPYLVAWTVPQSGLEWLNLLTLPVLVIGIAILANLAAEELRTRRARLIHAFEVQQEALEEAQDSEAIARSILDTVQAGVAFVAIDGEYIANERALETAVAIGLGASESRYSGARMYTTDRVTPISPEEQPIPRGLAGETVEQHFAWVGEAHRQSAIITSTSPVRRDTGELLGTVIVMYDVTDLAEAIEIREQFLRTVSHELRTPLTAAVGYLDLLDEDPDLPPRLASRLDTVRRGMERLTTRIAELMAASDDGVELQRVRVEIGQLVEDSAGSLGPAARGRVMRFGTDGTGLVADVDPRRLSQAIGELLTNAIKFGADDMPVIVRLSGDADSIELQITDTGPGMSRAELTRAFDSFYRAPAARAQAIQGFGLGLHIVRNIFRAHGGNVELRSEVGVGTTVICRLPRPVA
ncbi:Signal transduction histidine kinase [Microbacterium sp. C448]|uniref:sensor histidine kinase n=1 Tax=Microbacterium sp. C448 TaxID=1177594 RepID=UPI0003DE0074|nr:ATP-binding protein [Microbacterium sp. C448]CDJ99122.1 Signal transduction histidine kinase [Microbacterium sp. C448]